MPIPKINSLPVDLATRVYIDSVSHSNPLPHWLDSKKYPYDQIAQLIKGKIVRYTKNQEDVKPAYKIDVPLKAGITRTWLIPSVNDQIILHACTIDLESSLYLDDSKKSKVFSYQGSPDKIDFLNRQLEQWIAFQDETLKRMKPNGYILQLDLKKAYANFDRKKVFSYFAKKSGNKPTVDLLAKLINGWTDDTKGLPLVNDSLFFLGDAYLDTVDTLIEKHSANFIRFVDDYRFFGDSKKELETVFESVSNELASAGFVINQKKVCLGPCSDFIKMLSVKKYKEEPNEYLGPLLFAEVIDPERLVEYIAVALNKPEQYLTVSYGRLLTRELRKLRANAQSGSFAYNAFVSKLAKNRTIRKQIIELTTTYSSKTNESWRIVWLLHLLEDLVRSGKKVGQEKKMLAGLIKDSKTDIVVRLWAKRLLLSPAKLDESKTLFNQQDVSYIQEGKLIYGES